MKLKSVWVSLATLWAFASIGQATALPYCTYLSDGPFHFREMPRYHNLLHTHFANFESTLASIRSRTPEQFQIRGVMGSAVAINNFGIFRTEILHATGVQDSVLKIFPEKTLHELIFSEDSKGMGFESRVDPLDTLNHSAEARRNSAHGVLVQELIYQIGKMTGLSVVPRVQGLLSAAETRSIVKDPIRRAQVNYPESWDGLRKTDNSNYQLEPSWGFFSSRLDIAVELRETSQLRKLPKSKLKNAIEQINKIASLFDQLGLYVGDPNLVIDKSGKVWLLDCDEVIVFSQGRIWAANPAHALDAEIQGFQKTGPKNNGLRKRAEEIGQYLQAHPG